MQESENGRMQKPAKGTIYHYENSINSQCCGFFFKPDSHTTFIWKSVKGTQTQQEIYATAHT